LFEVFKEASRGVTLQTAGIAAKLATIEKWLQDNKLSDTNILPMLILDIDTSEDEKALRHLMIELQNISEINKKIGTNNQYKSLLQGIDIGAIQSSPIAQLQSPDRLQIELGNWQALATGATRTLTRLKTIKEECPTCKQPIDISAELKMVADATKEHEHATEQMNAIKPQIQTIKDNNDIFTSNERARQDWENLYRSVDTGLQTHSVDREELDSRISILQSGISESKRRSAEIYVENEKRTRSNTRIQVVQEQTDAFLAQLEECQKELAVQNKLESNLEVLKKSFSTNGLLAYKIENLVKELEELANEYLAELSDGRFTLEFVVSNDKLNVQITDNGNIVDILALSSGELARVNTATLIAIRKLMSSISKSRINVLFLDEVINVLDDAGREKMVEVLLGEDLNTYIVSHGWTHPLLEKIEVVKNGNVSGLE
jgi:DNA repair exonuclease SbcCD ATPase subunit